MGDYPGSGYKMSSYGLKTYNPQEMVGQWTQCCKVYYITLAFQYKYKVFILFLSCRFDRLGRKHLCISSGPCNSLQFVEVQLDVSMLLKMVQRRQFPAERLPFTNELFCAVFFLIPARRCDPKESYCHHWRGRCC